MKWINGFLIFGMVMLAHSTVSINDIEASPTAAHDKKAKGTTAKGSTAEEPKKKGSLFSSFTSGLKKVGSKIADGAKSVKYKASNAAACRSGKGEAPGAKLYDMAKNGTPLTDAHVVASHTAAAPKSGRTK